MRKEFAGYLESQEGAPGKCGVFRLDLSGAKMVDSVGLNLVVAMLKHLQKQGARMQVAYASKNVLRTFAFTRLDQHVELVKA